MTDHNRLEDLESAVAHLTRTIEDLSDITARQQSEIDGLTRRVQMLMEREAEREQAMGVGEIVGDGRPPHW